MDRLSIPSQEERVKGPSLIGRALHLYWRFARPMTLGTRAAIIHPERGVYLVRHGYVRGWQMPGGGVEAGETLHAAMVREVWEETHIEVTGAAALHGMFLNRHVSNRDHVAVFVVRAFREGPFREPDAEIREGRFFPLDALPEDVTRGTRARLEEIATGASPSPTW
ncbi:DNA mismatch repair protein MutT [Alsobacter soli]|uniref:DNA mismatch repair protein MutT n=1 Tax=Alsobacter soli TaxID=2109933 RepID=A0A2T1HZ49_9HYPH|nr:NUDIX domain-containing protein [Alsobacter soli]PSC06858.1 DNA mismatch repair protein MutT [Alsobacter soli]